MAIRTTRQAIPIEQITNFELVLNLRTAKLIGVKICAIITNVNDLYLHAQLDEYQ